MAITKAGAIKIAAKKIGISVGGYQFNIALGFLWCTGCRKWHRKEDFSHDASRWSDRNQSCKMYKKRIACENYIPIPPEKRKLTGPPPGKPRAGDKTQARHRVNVLVRTGKIPKPNELPCVDCGHQHKEGGKRHEYDHHNGYGAEHHLDVISLCSTCHHRRHPKNGEKH